MAICFLGLESGIQKDFSMTVALSCLALIAMVGRASAKIALTGVVLICPLIALPAYL